MRVVTAAIIEHAGKVLIARRSPNSKLAGQWEFPGGKLEEGETLEECLVRELKEELGIETEVGAHFYSGEYAYAHGSFRIEAFKVAWKSGDFDLRAHDRVEWIDPAEFGRFVLLPADLPIAEKLKSNAG